MSRISILNETEQLEFDYPPNLSPESKALAFTITPELDDAIHRLRKPTNKVGFLLQYAYFKACHRFFTIDRFRQKDIHYAARLLGIDEQKIDLSQYRKKIPTDHQKVILELMDAKPFDKIQMEWIETETQRRIQQFTEPRQLFLELLNLIVEKQIELPSYHYFAELITRRYLDYEGELTRIVKAHLTEDDKKQLDCLLHSEKSRSRGRLADFRSINQSLKPKAIQASVVLYQHLAEVFVQLIPCLNALKLSPQTCEYYAVWVKKAKLSQIKNIVEDERRYLHLISFVQHQVCLRQDNFVDIQYFQAHDGQIDEKAPQGFLKLTEQEVIIDDAGKFRVSLYKVLLFFAIADAIKSGEINLNDSYRYLAVQDYLIDKNRWQEEKEELFLRVLSF